MAYNFNAGPAVLPPAVLQQAQAELCNYRGLGYSLLEASHRSPEFEEVIQAAETNIRELLGVPAGYTVLFLQGGASTQFAMIPMNLLGVGQTAAYLESGYWAERAIKEAQLFGQVKVVGSTRESGYVSLPAVAPGACPDKAAYLHLTSNNTIYGTQFHAFPEAPAGVPLIADMSSDIMSRPVPVERFAMIYAGAQKNIGPAGVTVVIMRTELLARTPKSVPTMLRYSTHADNQSMYNTPPTFSIYLVRLVTDWLKREGGLGAIAKRNEAKGKAIYDLLDEGGFYRGPVQPAARSLMNVVFRLPSEELEKKFVAGATKAGMIGLKGHRAVGGVRASLYNALDLSAAQVLADYMREFRRLNG